MTTNAAYVETPGFTCRILGLEAMSGKIHVFSAFRMFLQSNNH